MSGAETDKQDVVLPWVELQDLLMYFHTMGDEKAVAMLRGLKTVAGTVVPESEVGK